MITTYDTYDPSDTTDVNTVGAISENKFLGDTLDYLTFATRDSYILDKYSNCVNYGTDNYNATKQYAAYSDDFDSITGLHSLTYIDPTRMLDELTINGIAMTNQTTQLAGFNKLIDKINCRLGFEGYQLTFNNNHHEILDDNSACQEVILDGIHTVREVLDYYLSTWDLSCRLKLNGSAVYEIYIVSPNKQGSSLNLSQYNVKISMKGENYTNAIVTSAKNLVPDNEVKEYGLNIISDQIPFNTDAGYIETLYNIYEMSKVTAYVPTVLPLYMPVGIVNTYNVYLTGYMIPFDVTPNVRDKEEFDTLSTTDRVANAYYTRGSKKIEHISTLDGDMAAGYTKQVVLERMVGASLTRLNNEIDANEQFNRPEIIAWYSTLPQAAKTYVENYLTSQGETLDFTTYEGVGFKIYAMAYTTQSDLWSSTYFDLSYIAKDDFEVRKGGSGLTTIDNQSSGTLDETRYLTSLQYKLERLNCEEVDLSTNANVFEVGDYYDNYVIDKLQIAHNGLNEQCNYHLQENYNAVGERVDVNRELRLYSIPTDRYVKATFEKQVLASNLNNADGILINGSVILTNSTLNGQVYIPFVRIGKEATIRFKDNYAIRYYHTTDDNGHWHKTINVSEAIRYCDSNGELNSTISIKLVKYKPDEANYPFNNNCTYVATVSVTFIKDAYEQIELVLRGGFNS